VGGIALGLRFLDIAAATWERLRECPGFGAPCEVLDPRLTELRHCRLGAPFDGYVVFYRFAGDETLEVVRVLHGARNLPMHVLEADQ
jgi:plasmid stabilization system protein ParE